MRNTLRVLGIAIAVLVVIAGYQITADHKEVICHYPQGIPDHPGFTIVVGSASAASHLRLHTTQQDRVGACEIANQPVCDGEDDCQ